MPEVPRDPRQLARDILSGKIRIEDLARERQARGGGGAAPAPPQRPAPARQFQSAPIRTTPAQSLPQSTRPVAKPVARPVQRPNIAPPRKPAVKQQPAPVRSQPQPAMARNAIETTGDTASAAPASIASAAAATKSAARDVRSNVRAMLKSRHTLRQAVLLSEILGPPICQRD